MARHSRHYPGGIIAFSVVFCIARCICCGAECAICCCKCCSCCAGGSDRGHKRMKSENQGYPPPQPYPQQPYSSAPANPYAEARSFAPPPPPPPQINTQYQSHAAPTFTPPGNPNFNPQTNPKFARPASPVQPQFATFDAHSKPVNEDALPAMPSWKDARDVHVEVEEAVPENGATSRWTDSITTAAYRTHQPVSPRPEDCEARPAQQEAPYPQFTTTPHTASPKPSTTADHPQLKISPHHRPTLRALGIHKTTTHAALPPRTHTASTAKPRRLMTAARQALMVVMSNPTTNPTIKMLANPTIHPQPTLQYLLQPHTRTLRFPAPPSYHTTANPYAYSPVQVQDQMPGAAGYPGGGGSLNGGGVVQSNGGGYDNLPLRSQTASPAAYPGQQAYQAFQPGVQRKAVEGSARDV